MPTMLPGTIAEPFSIYRGDTWVSPDMTVRLQERDAEGNPVGSPEPVDLSVGVLRAELRTAPGGDLITSLTIVPVDLENGVVAFTLTSTQTKLLPPGNYQFDLEQVRHPGPPPLVQTWVLGSIRIVADITENL